MKMFRASVPLLVLALAACSEPPTASILDQSPSYVKGENGGGKGSPHFSEETVCTYDAGLVYQGHNGRIACDYQISGLAANSNGVGTLVANIPFTYFCDKPGDDNDVWRDVVKVAIDFYYYADKKGNVKGTVSGTPNAVGLPCIGGANHLAEFLPLDSQASPLAIPYLTGSGSWALFGLSTTPKGGPSYVFFGGGWTQAPSA